MENDTLVTSTINTTTCDTMRRCKCLAGVKMVKGFLHLHRLREAKGKRRLRETKEKEDICGVSGR